MRSIVFTSNATIPVDRLTQLSLKVLQEVDQSIDSGFLVVKGWNTASKESEVHDGGRARHHARVGYGPGEKMASKSKRLSCATWTYHPTTTAR